MAVCATRGFKLYYETHGGGDGVPLVMITGPAGSCQGWTVLTVPELSKDRQNVIFDNRGAGRSEAPDAPFTTADMAEDTLALLDHLEIERAHVLGNSLGGMVAQQLALDHPDRVQSLVLVGTAGQLDGKRRMLMESWKAMSEVRVPFEIFIQQRLVWTLHDLTFKQDELLEEIQRIYHEEGSPVSARIAMAQMDAVIEHDTLDQLERLDMPALIVCGDQDQMFPVHMHRQLANRIPNARLVQITGAGHLVIAEMAPRFNRLVNRFLLEYDKPQDWSAR